MTDSPLRQAVRAGAAKDATATVLIETGGTMISQTFEGARAVNMILVCLGAVERALRYPQEAAHDE